MNQLYQKLNLITKENEIRAKVKRQNRTYIVNVAWSMLKKNLITVFEYNKILSKNL